MAKQPNPGPYWIDCLHEKHECWDYNHPGLIKARHGGKSIKIILPDYLTGVRVLPTAESGRLLFLIGRSKRREKGLADGVLMVAKRRKADTFEVGVWHELYTWALKHLGLEPSSRS